jgi:GcrA cell cycle regulator
MKRTVKPIWNLETEQIIREMWNNKEPTRMIADKLGITRNAVIGKARRMNLLARAPRKPSANTKPDDKEIPTRAARMKLVPFKDNPERRPLQWSPAVTRLTKPDNPPVGILDAAFHHCRAVVGIDGTSRRLALFCGAQIMEGKSYCPYHQSLYYQVRGVSA